MKTEYCLLKMNNNKASPNNKNEANETESKNQKVYCIFTHFLFDIWYASRNSR